MGQRILLWAAALVFLAGIVTALLLPDTGGIRPGLTVTFPKGTATPTAISIPPLPRSFRPLDRRTGLRLTAALGGIVVASVLVVAARRVGGTGRVG